MQESMPAYLPESRLGPDDFQVLKVVGQGAFGKVPAVHTSQLNAPVSSETHACGMVRACLWHGRCCDKLPGDAG